MQNLKLAVEATYYGKQLSITLQGRLTGWLDSATVSHFTEAGLEYLHPPCDCVPQQFLRIILTAGFVVGKK